MGSRIKSYFFSGPATERDGGKGLTTKKNSGKCFVATKLEGGGGGNEPGKRIF